MFVGNLAHDMTDRTLKEFFSKWGNVLEVKVLSPSLHAATPKLRLCVVVSAKLTSWILCVTFFFWLPSHLKLWVVGADNSGYGHRPLQRVWLHQVRRCAGRRRCHSECRRKGGLM